MDDPAPRFSLLRLTGVVDRGRYARWGFGLSIAKYLIDVLIVWLVVERLWMPLDYLNPLMSARESALGSESLGWFQVVMGIWSLPFLAIGLSLTMRRAVHAGLSPWLAILFFVPLINYLLMLALCLIPGRDAGAVAYADDDPMLQHAPGKRPAGLRLGNSSERGDTFIGKTLVSIGISAAIPLIGVRIAGEALESYAWTLFFFLPFMLGASAGFLFNRPVVIPIGHTLKFALLSAAIAVLCVLLFALEGVLCILMVMPMFLPLILLGAWFGRRAAMLSNEPARNVPASFAPFALSLLLVPIGAAVEKRFERAVLFEAVSVIEIDAPPEAIWPHVISFSELPEPDWILFKLGIAYPVRAVIDGEGVGAVRHCEFSTGAFVEPITAWEPPHRLAFDVRAHPAPMHEWSPYEDLAPPHLEDFFRSVRGEFRLIELSGGRTRLEGSTWYELRYQPVGYWRLWSDLLVHRIHGEVLRQIEREVTR